MGYVITGMKSTRAARLGDTWHLLKHPVEPLPGFKPIKSMVFAGDLPAQCAVKRTMQRPSDGMLPCGQRTAPEGRQSGQYTCNAVYASGHAIYDIF